MFSASDLLNLLNKKFARPQQEECLLLCWLEYTTVIKKELLISNAGHEPPLFIQRMENFLTIQKQDHH